MLSNKRCGRLEKEQLFQEEKVKLTQEEWDLGYFINQ